MGKKSSFLQAAFSRGQGQSVWGSYPSPVPFYSVLWEAGGEGLGQPLQTSSRALVATLLLLELL